MRSHGVKVLDMITTSFISEAFLGLHCSFCTSKLAVEAFGFSVLWRNLYTSLHPSVQDEVPVFVDHVTLPRLALPTFGYCHLLQQTFPRASPCSSFFSLFSLWGRRFYKRARANPQNIQAGFQNTLLESTPLIALDRIAPVCFSGSGTTGFWNAHLHLSQHALLGVRSDSRRKRHYPLEGGCVDVMFHSWVVFPTVVIRKPKGIGHQGLGERSNRDRIKETRTASAGEWKQNGGQCWNA